MLKINSIDKEHVKMMLDNGIEIDGFEGSFEIPLEALNLPVDERSVTSDQDVEQDAVLVPVPAMDCMRVLFQDDTKAIVSTEKMIRHGRFKNADPEWLKHLADVFGAENILTRSETHKRVLYLQVEQRYLALSDDEKSVLLFALQAYTPEGSDVLQSVMEFELWLIDKEISKIEYIKEETARLSEVLYEMTVEDKKQICRDYSISGFSTLNESGLVDLIVTAYFSGKIPRDFYLKGE